MKDQVRVAGLFIYPVKSCRGIQLNEMKIGPTGPLFDRQWMIVDSENRFLTLRTLSKLAEIRTALSERFLQLYVGSNKILINIDEECEQIEEVTVWNDAFLAGIENKNINEALSEFLSKTVKLVRYQKQSFRDLKLAATEAVKQVMFSDSRPVLLVNQNSLNDLNQKLSLKNYKESFIERFRANIIIDGLAAYEEEKISEVQVGEILFKNPKLCTRCPVITQDVETGKVISKETLITLAEDQKSRINSTKVIFGVNLTPAASGIIKVGDLISIKSI